jgi:outer membrane receptor protein involved in Fe transport
MYYNNIGNVNLKPEIAYQSIYNIEFNLLKNKDVIRLNSSVYYNKVENQILALPTKNLFVWSIQNIGKVDVFGGDLKLSYSQLFYQKLKVIVDANYTFQQVLDVSDKNSPSHRNQVAYIPVHTFSSDLLLKFKNVGMRWSAYSNGIRYALNENIEANRLNAFWVNDFGIWYEFKSEKTPLKVHFSVKNSMNTSYEFVKYFVMPGRNYLITLNYAIR